MNKKTLLLCFSYFIFFVKELYALHTFETQDNIKFAHEECKLQKNKFADKEHEYKGVNR